MKNTKKNELDFRLRSARIRLIVGIPATTALFALSTGILGFSLPRIASPAEPRLMLYKTLLVLAMTGVALFAGILLAYGITKPLKEMKKRGEEILSSPSLPSQHNEISDLSQVFNQMYFSLSQFIKDHQILDNLPQGLIILDDKGTIVTANRLSEKILGSSLCGRSYREVIQPHPQSMAFLACVEKALRGEQDHFSQEITLRNKQGEVSFLWVSIFPLDHPKGIAVSLKDINELGQVRKQIRRAETLAGMGTLISILSHEIRTPLGSIRGLLELLHEGLPAEDRKKNYVRRVIQEIDRLIHISEDILDFASIDELELEDGVNLNHLLEQSLAWGRHEFRAKNISILEKYEEELPLVRADASKLYRAFLNLVINAFQATPEGGRISLSTKRVPSAISIRIHNTGSYIKPEELESIFRPSYSTKPDGSGFGLFLAKRIVLSHNGTIDVKSDPEEGTTFRIELPLGEEGGTDV